MAWRLVEKPSANVANVQRSACELEQRPCEVVVELPETSPASYFLDELEALRHLSNKDIREIHLAKIRLGGQRVGGQ